MLTSASAALLLSMFAHPSLLESVAEHDGTAIFQCMVGKKGVRVLHKRSTLTHQFGAPGRTKISITGSASSGNLFYMVQQYSGRQLQLRFTWGEYCYIVYIVYTVDDTTITDRPAFAGLTVKRGLSDRVRLDCSNSASFAEGFDYETLPSDVAEFTAL